MKIVMSFFSIFKKTPDARRQTPEDRSPTPEDREKEARGDPIGLLEKGLWEKIFGLKFCYGWKAAEQMKKSFTEKGYTEVDILNVFEITEHSCSEYKDSGYCYVIKNRSGHSSIPMKKGMFEDKNVSVILFNNNGNYQPVFLKDTDIDDDYPFY